MTPSSVMPMSDLPGVVWALWQRLTAWRKRQFLALSVLMVLSSFAEVFSIGALVPFLGALTTPEVIFNHPAAQNFVELLGIKTPSQLVLPTALVFVAAAILAGGIRLLLLVLTTRYSFAVGADLSVDMYRRSLHRPYIVHTTRNSSELIAAITGKSAMVTGSVLTPLLALISAVFLLVGIVAALLVIDAAVAMVAIMVFGVAYGLILIVTKRHLEKNGTKIARESVQVIKSLQEGFGGIRDVLISGTQELYCRIYQRADLPMRAAQGRNLIISASPRFVIETIGMILVAAFAYYMSQRPGGVAAAIPVLGALALGAQRLLPVLQQCYASLAIVRGAEASIRDVLELLDQPLPEQRPIDNAALEFRSEIELESVGFNYSDSAEPVLRNISATIPKGNQVGFIGATGSGKSTLLDLLMGLLEPATGAMKIDGVPVTLTNQAAWRAHIAHVPQAIFLSDSSIAQNIAFGVPSDELDMDKVKLAAKQAQVAETIESWPDGYDTKVGERGVRLSGGQRQRIGIARALYKQADVLIFDEATSALDNKTEKAVMKAIDQLPGDLTVLIVAHRLTTLKNCDLIIELADGCVSRHGSYNELVPN